MTIPDEAVQAAHDAYLECVFLTEEQVTFSLEKILTAAQPFLTGVKVKALTWTQEDTSYWRAATSCGSYGVNKMKEGYFEMDGDVYADLEAAKAAAFQDYQSRILSALEL
ncbi:hypothetical protein D6J61_26545 [Salmonella enterica subsp. enterica serovar Alachua]|nr:hypothetical protein [Salmonella enterica subsp. enterica serovar Alachua]